MQSQYRKHKRNLKLLPGWVPIANAAMARRMADPVLPIISRVLDALHVDTDGVPDMQTGRRTWTNVNNVELARRTGASMRGVQRALRRLARANYIIIEYDRSSVGPERTIRQGRMLTEATDMNGELLSDSKSGQGHLPFETPARAAPKPVSAGTLFDIPRRQITALAVGSSLQADKQTDQSKLSPHDNVVTTRHVTPRQSCHPMHSEKDALKKTDNKENNVRPSAGSGGGVRLDGAATATSSQRYPPPPEGLDDVRLQQWLMMDASELQQVAVNLGDAYGRALNNRNHKQADQYDAERKWVLTLIHIRAQQNKSKGD